MPTAGAPPRPLLLRALVLVGALLGSLLVSAGPASGAAMELGYRDHSYGTSVTAPTADKPQSKLWHVDGSWWGVLWAPSAKRFTIHRFNLATEATNAWTSTGVAVDVRRNSQADVLWDEASRKLYVVTHLKDSDTKTPDRGIRFLRYGFAGGTWSQEASHTVVTGAVESAVLDKDSTGRLWLTYAAPNAVGGRTVMVAHSTTSDTAWSAPAPLPVDAEARDTSAQDLSTVVAYGPAGARRTGVLWSNARTSALYFASRADTDAVTADWSLTTLCSTRLCPDDHLNIKSIDGDAAGNLYAVVKTSLNDRSVPVPSDPLMVVYRLNPAGTWDSTTAWTVADDVTRAIVVLDSSNRAAHLFAAGPCCSGGTVWTKKAPFDDLRFPSGHGTPFMRSERLAEGEAINNVTSTKQTVNATTGLLVLAGIDRTRDYVHRHQALGTTSAPAPSDTTAPTVTATSPPSGTTGVDPSAAVTASFSEAVDASTVSGSTFALRSSTGQAVPAAVSYDAAAARAVLRPSSALASGSTYEARLTGGAQGVRDVAGNALAADVAWSFTTASAPAPSQPAAPPQRLGEVARATATTSGSTLVLTTTTAVPAGARVVLATGFSGSAGVVVKGVADDSGAAWATHVQRDNGGTTGATSAVLSAVVGAAGLPSGTRITVTLSASVTYRLGVAHAFSGATTVAATSSATGSSSTPAAAPVAAVAGDVLYGMAAWNSGTITHTPGGSTVELAELAAGTKTMAVRQLDVTSAGNVTDAGTLSSAVVWTDAAVLLRG